MKWRAPQNSDFARIKMINDAAHLFPWTEKNLRNELEHRHEFSEVILDEKENLLAYIFIRGSGGEFELMSVAVDPRAQGKGWGRKLLESFIGKVKETRADDRKIRLEVSQKNLVAIKLYEKMGFRRSRERKNYYPDGSSALEMALKLT